MSHFVFHVEEGIWAEGVRECKIFGPKRDKVIWNWRKLQTEELHVMQCSANVTQMIAPSRMKWAGRVARMAGEQREAYRVLVG